MCFKKIKHETLIDLCENYGIKLPHRRIFGKIKITASRNISTRTVGNYFLKYRLRNNSSVLGNYLRRNKGLISCSSTIIEYMDNIQQIADAVQKGL